jgi:alpha-tubulin suppressor-like RCC1 family protein
MHVLAMAHDSNPLLVNPTETVWGWGFNERGQLGNNPAIGGVSDPDAFVPVQALQGGTTVIGSGSPITDVLEIYAFGNSSLAKIQHAGGIPQLLGWGENSFGQLGFPITTTGLGYLAVPVAVAGF